MKKYQEKTNDANFANLIFFSSKQYNLYCPGGLKLFKPEEKLFLQNTFLRQ